MTADEAGERNHGIGTARWFLLLGAANAALAVLAGAFGAHGLNDSLPDNLMHAFNTGVTYHFWHALGLLVVGLTLERRRSSRLFRISGWLMLAGIVLFCGSLYALALSGIRVLGVITPFGGMAFIVAWCVYAVAAGRLS